ncbi:pyridoxal phosphate-dependent aminotransferase [Ruminiclostridium herbifermentans]|uniref:cysteine-S-conjugate beta-lyase n=1 Tax=Ruminiclostridium herbifermentans TaxID=2488810 RepID=A0A4U7JFA4_9FIRM|nr:MalY/PatB family protein [Ruminiclostridium herbifermentans]QNU67443.1 pyridoxal phosphate-dependent aminotransferase [Ruminiclostridium herbifermentans]
MKYNFDEIIDRKSTFAEKHAKLKELYGSSELIPLWVADMDFKVAQPIIDAMKDRIENGIFGYTMRPDSYFDDVCEFQKKRKNWNIDKKLMSSCLGVMPSICMIIQKLTNPGDKVIIQTPVYRPFFNAVKQASRELLESPLKEVDGRYYMNYEDLEEKAKQGAKYLILCSPHNPVGRVWSFDELKKLGDICLKYGIKVISDEIHSDLILWGNKHTPFASISEQLREITISCISATKTFNLAGLQSSIVIFPNEELKHQFDQMWDKLHVEGNNCMSIAAIQAAFRHGEEWLEQLLKYIEENVNFVKNYFDKYIPKIKVERPEGTYLMWLDCRQLGLNGGQLTRFMTSKAGVAMSSGTYFGSNGEGFMRMNVACPRAILEKALEQIRIAVSEL